MVELPEKSDDIDVRRHRLYEAYVSTHAGKKVSSQEALIFRNEIMPRLPVGNLATLRIVDVGCGQGQLVNQLHRHGYLAASGIDISPEQISVAQESGVERVECGDYRDLLRRNSGGIDVVIATDFLEHFEKDEILSIFDAVKSGLRPGGVFIVRSPNGSSPFFGNYQFSDFTHETILAPGSFSQVSLITGFVSAASFPCPPVERGLKGLIRKVAWSTVAASLWFALAAETGGRNHIVTQNFIGVATA